MTEDISEVLTISSIEERKELRIDIEEMLETQPKCCICKVPKDLREINEKAYTPKVISIGPLHHGKEELLDMEKKKIIYKREFGKRIPSETWQPMITCIETHEQNIRNCYEGMPKFEKLDFVTMVLYDAVFIIELFLRYHEEKSDLLDSRLIATIYLDLQLLENQLPYFFLNELYMLVSPKFNSRNSYPSFFVLSCCLFWHSMFNRELPHEVEVKHFVDLRRHILTNKHPKSVPTEAFRALRSIPSAVKLQEYGVKFRLTEGKGILDIRLLKKKLWIPGLPVYESYLEMPDLEVYDETECWLRNVMALERLQYPSETHVCNYIELMGTLINTEEDVKLFAKAGIISNYMGDDASIAKMFKELHRLVHLSPSCYNGIIKDLQAHYNNPRNRAIAAIKRVYFRNWRGTGTVAALTLLCLTLLQAVCSILQVL